MSSGYNSDNGTSWTPIGSLKKKFMGHFDGGNHKIENIYINSTESYQGLFGYVESGTIENLTVSGNVTGKQYVGLVCGMNRLSSVKNCHTLEGSAVSSSNTILASTICGGICGQIQAQVYNEYNNPADITECTNAADVSGAGAVGGIFGSSMGGGTISNCINKGKVQAKQNSTNSSGVGGIGGTDAHFNGKISNCHNEGTVTTEGIYTGIGGILGNTAGSKIEDCYNTGSVDGDQWIGGICGNNNQLNKGATILRCYNQGKISGSYYVGGICGKIGNGKERDMTVVDCFNTGNVQGKSVAAGGVCGRITVTSEDQYGNYSGGIDVIRCYNIGVIDNGFTSDAGEYDMYHSNVYGYLDASSSLTDKYTIDNCFYQLHEDAETNMFKDAAASPEGCEPKNKEQFTSGEVAYLLRSAQTEASEALDSEGESVVWSQKLYGDDKDEYPVLSDEEDRKPLKVQFMTLDSKEDSQEKFREFCSRYTNPNQTVSLPENPESNVYKFLKWSTSSDGFNKEENDFTGGTLVTEDGITVYAIGEEMYGTKSGNYEIETTCGTEAEFDLSQCVEFAQTEGTADKFTYTIENGNDTLKASIKDDILKVPNTAPAANAGYTLTIKAHKKSQELALMLFDSLNTENLSTLTPLNSLSTADCTFEVKVIVKHVHEFGTEWKTDGTGHWHECACGEKAGTAAHTEDSGSVTKEPTETETGIRTYKCIVCGYVMRTEEIGKLTPAPTETPGQTEPPAKKPQETVTPEETKENSEKLDSGISTDFDGNKFNLAWEEVDGAEGYDIFAARCGRKMTAKSRIKTVKGKKTSASLAKIAGRKISGKSVYKVKIKAWRYVDGKKVYIGSSKTYHVAGKANKKYTNAKKLKPAKKKYVLKKGRSTRIKVTIVKQSKKKKLLSKAHGPALRYASSDKKIATITQKGVVKAKKKGTCYITVTALNGVRTRIKITVK